MPIGSVGDIEALPWPPRHLNLKLDRFGSVRRLFDRAERPRARDVQPATRRG
ncbi:MAG TPA: hypothetical protein VF231_04135 [Candidatus Limnocylindrales bacterium]